MNVTTSQQVALKLLGVEVNPRTYGAVIEDEHNIYLTWFVTNTYWELTNSYSPEVKDMQRRIIQIMGSENVIQ